MSKNSDEIFGEAHENPKSENYNTSESSELYSDENSKYIKYVFLLNNKNNILIKIMFIRFIISEFFFRKPLFDKSTNFIEKLQENLSDITIDIFKIITKIGAEYLTGVPVAIVLIFFSIIKSSFYIAGFLFILHYHSLIKLWYGSSRPFWESPNLYKGIGDGGFGNPSGHAITTIFLNFVFFIYLKESFLNKKYKLQIVLLIFLIVFVIMVILSRVVLGIHSINQVLYGAGLGIFSYLLFINMFKLHQMPIIFYKKLFKDKIIIFCISGIISLLILLSILSAIFLNSNFDKDYYDEILNELTDLPKYRRFNLDGLFGSFAALAILGMYLGQVVFWYLIDNSYKMKNELIIKSSEYFKGLGQENFEEDSNNRLIDSLINNWNINRSFRPFSLKKITKIILILILCFSPLLLFLLISNDANTILMFIFKFGIPFFATLFFIYSFGFYYIIIITCGQKEELLKRANDRIYNNNIV